MALTLTSICLLMLYFSNPSHGLMEENVSREQLRLLEMAILRIPETFTLLSNVYQSTYLQEFDENKWEDLRNLTLSSTCNKDIIYTLKSLKQEWAFKMLDANAKIPSGIAKGAILFWLGNYDVCLDVNAPHNKVFPSEGFTGRYCTLKISFTSLGHLPSFLALHVGICVPSSCDQGQLITNWKVFKNFTEKIPVIGDLLKEIPLSLSEITCEPLPDEAKFSSASICCMVFLAVSFGLVAAATIYDIYLTLYVDDSRIVAETIRKMYAQNSYESTSEQITQRPVDTHNSLALIEPKAKIGKLREIFLAFSALKNVSSILDTSDQEGQINCVHGIRVLSLGWTVLLNTLVIALIIVENAFVVVDLLQDFPIQPLILSFSTDSLYLISGFLMAYLVLKEQNIMTWIDWVYFVVHRLIRLTPVYMVLLFVYATCWKYLGEGPMWSIYEKLTHTCGNWWYNLLYINNFQDANDQCMSWTSYSANMMQFCLVSPMFLIPLKSSKYRYVGLTLIGTLIIGSWITTGIVSSQNGLMAPFNGYRQDPLQMTSAADMLFSSYNVLFDKPWIRNGPYLIGVLLGCLIVETKKRNWNVRRVFAAFGWIAFIPLNMTVVYGLYNNSPDVELSAWYNALAKSVWALTVAWIIYACFTKNAGPVNSFLSWSFFKPLSRLSYCAYLINPMVIAWYCGNLQKTYYLTLPGAFLMVFGLIFLSYGLSFLFSLVYEVPIVRIEKLFKKK